MAHSQTEIKRMVLRELEKQNATVTKLGSDGSDHQVVDFIVSDTPIRFHYPTTIGGKSRAFKNTICRLRRIIREKIALNSSSALALA